VDLTACAAILGSSGGGDPFIGRTIVQQALSKELHVEILDLEDVFDDAFAVSTAMTGAPSVVVEKIATGVDAVNAFGTAS